MKHGIRVVAIVVGILIAGHTLSVFGNRSTEPEDIRETIVHHIIVTELPRETAPEPQPLAEPKPTTMLARVTAYAPFDNKSGMCADENPAVTSTGVRPGPEHAAVDPARIPYGTKMDIPGYGVVKAADTGGALRRSEHIAIDVYFDTYEEAIAWGVQFLEIEILEEEPRWEEKQRPSDKMD